MRASGASGERPRFVAGYEVLRVLGRGGMGAVYAVRDPGAPRELALKQLLGSDPEALVRFQREAELLGRVRHRNVLAVHAVGSTPEGPYLLAELIEGETLAARLARGPLSPREAAAIVRDLAEGLARCHALGLVHRDLKPQNVMLRTDGSPVLIDFGVARDLAGQRLTRSGDALGTPAYMAPEQARGGEVDARTDVYGLGAILYEALTARPPFNGPHALAVMTQVALAEPEWPSAQGLDVPAGLEAILRGAMAREPDGRLPSADALRAALDGWLRGSAGRGAESPPARGLVGTLVVAAGAAVLAGAVAVAARATTAPSSAPIGPVGTSAPVAAPSSAATGATRPAPVRDWAAAVRASRPARRPDRLQRAPDYTRAEELSRCVNEVLTPRVPPSDRARWPDLHWVGDEPRLRARAREELEALSAAGLAGAEVALGRLLVGREPKDLPRAAELFWRGSRLEDPDDFALLELVWLLQGTGEQDGAEWLMAECASRLERAPHGDVSAQLAVASAHRGEDSDLGRALRLLAPGGGAPEGAAADTLAYLARSQSWLAAALLEFAREAGWTELTHARPLRPQPWEVRAVERLRARWRLRGTSLLTCTAEADRWCAAQGGTAPR